MAKQTFLKIFLACCALLVLSTAAYADPFTFSTLPTDGNISGTAGSTIGWGYRITNLSTNWLVATNLSAGLFLNGTPNALFDFPILAPGAVVSVVFDALAGSGLYGLTWNATAPVGFTNSGTFVLSAEFWNGDPFAGGNFLSTAPDQSAAYSASVSGGSTPVPAPSTFILLATGLAAVLASKRRTIV